MYRQNRKIKVTFRFIYAHPSLLLKLFFLIFPKYHITKLVVQFITTIIMLFLHICICFQVCFNTWSIFTFTLYRKLNRRKNIDMASNVVVTFLRSRAISSDNFYGRKAYSCGRNFLVCQNKTAFVLYLLSKFTFWLEWKKGFSNFGTIFTTTVHHFATI